MANWKLPYSIPKFTSDEFEKMKADYISKHGYQIYVPGWEDIVHMPLDAGFSETEEIHWAAKDWTYFSPERLESLKLIKERRKRMYLRLLQSTQPKILRNRGSILVALDNNQDALSTLSMIIRIAYTVVPLVWQKLLIGPVGWIMTASDILNLCTYVMTPERSALRTKRIKDAVTDKNPFSRKARIKRRAKILRGTISTGTIIEALQTTDQVFGYGISLGAVMNLPFELIAGSVQLANGNKVTISQMDPTPHFWQTQASTAWKSLTTLFTTEHIFDVAEALPLLICSHLMAVAMHVIGPSLDPKNQILNLDKYFSAALEPKKAYLREIMQENGDDPDGFTGWPVTGEKHSSCTAIHEEGYKIATANFQNWCHSNSRDMSAFYGAQRANDAAHFMLATFAGDDAVEYDYIAAEKITHSLLNAGYRLPFYHTLKSGYWETQDKMPLTDLPESIRKLGQIEEFKNNEPFDPSLHPDVENAVAALKNLQTPGDWLSKVTLYDRFGNKYFAPATADQVTIARLLQYYPETKFGADPPSPGLDNAHDSFKAKVTEYLNDHEINGSAPSTPTFKNFLKDTFGIELPMNETTEDQIGSPTIPLPTEIP